MTDENKILKEIYEEVKMDIQNMKEEIKWIHTTEDFFIWRDTIKIENNESSLIRNKIVEKTIEENQTLKLLYDWTKCYRILDKARAHIFLFKENLEQTNMYDKNTLEKLSFSSTSLLYKYLSINDSIHLANIFPMIKISNFGFRYNEFPPFHTIYEFLNIIMHEEMYGPFAIDILICLLRACNITGPNLICCGRSIEKEAYMLIRDFTEISSLKKQYKKTLL